MSANDVDVIHVLSKCQVRVTIVCHLRADSWTKMSSVPFICILYCFVGGRPQHRTPPCGRWDPLLAMSNPTVP